MRSLCVFLLLMLACALASGQPTIPSYYSASDLSLTSPGSLKFGLYGYDNPALLFWVRQPDLQVSWTDPANGLDLHRWGAFMAGPNAGFAAVHTRTAGHSLTDYRLSLAWGDYDMAAGIAYSFAGGDKGAFKRSNALSVGTLSRPTPYMSLGMVGTIATEGGASEAAFDLGIRPLGTELVTLFADYGIANGQSLREGAWSMGAAVEALPGIRLTGRYFDSHAFALGIDLSLGRLGFSGQSAWDRESAHAFNTYAVRIGAFDRTLLTKLATGSRYVGLNLFGPMKYQRFILFDNAQTLASTLEAIAAAKDDETVAGIAINTSGNAINGEMLWELRTQLQEFRAAGKHVVIFVDRPMLEDYCFATVADKIVMDPTGMLLLNGFSMSRTFLKGALAKLGIGYDEWRFFKYKSANENMSRDSFSDADREQRQKYLDDVYAEVKSLVCAGRKITPAQFDGLLNDDVVILPQEAMEKGLVDTLGRWEDVVAMAQRLEARPISMMGPGMIEKFNAPYDNRWGARPRIAVIYALGACAMDEGITARSLVHDVEAAGADPRVKAIILRVDSPGGDGTASDYIAEALKKAKKTKPVIVSQGSVAASGGYWLSMYADTILAAPTTITGSIGVIGGWMYNDGLKEKLGVSTDLVKAGAHADLGTGMRLPFVGLSLPDRNLTPYERSRVEASIKTYYKEFVAKVAAGRRTTPDVIAPIAEGHFYSGTEGKRINLVDVIGGMADALRIARAKAGIASEEDVTIVELPRPRLIDLSMFMPKLFGFGASVMEDPFMEQLKFRLSHNGEPLMMLPLELVPADAPRE